MPTHRATPRSASRPRTLHRRALPLTLAALLLTGTSAGALPRPGQSLPSFEAQDLRGEEHHSQELHGERTLVVAITRQEAGGALEEWFDAAREHILEGEVEPAALISLRLPFFVPASMVRGKARDRVPRQYWERTWLDDNGDMAEELGLRESAEPYVFVLDSRGRVLTSAQADVDDPEAERIWSALEGR